MDGILHKQKNSSWLNCSLPSLPCSFPTALAPATPWASSFLLLQPVWRIQWEAHFPPATAAFPSPEVKSHGQSVQDVQPGCQHNLSPALSTAPSPSHLPLQGHWEGVQPSSQRGAEHRASTGGAAELTACVTAGSSSTPWMEIKHRNQGDTQSQA